MLWIESFFDLDLLKDFRGQPRPWESRYGAHLSEFSLVVLEPDEALARLMMFRYDLERQRTSLKL